MVECECDVRVTPVKDLKYRRICTELRKDILSGRYNGSGAFPSIRALMMRFGLSKNTVLHALEELKKQGLISCSRGRTSAVTKIGANRQLGLVLPGIVPWSDYFRPIVDEISRLAAEEGFDLLFRDAYSATLKGRVRDVREIVAEFVRRKVAGVIYQPFEFAADGRNENQKILTSLTAHQVPVVLLDSDVVPPPGRSAYDLVTVDNVEAGERLANHLFEGGARNVHFFMCPEWLPTVLLRRRGVMCAALARGRRWSADNVLVARPDDKAALRRHLLRRPRPDAFVCQNDATAVALMRTLAELGVVVPDEMMVAGFADIQMARSVKPALTTVHQPALKIAETAFRRLVDRIVHPELPSVCISMQAPLVIRESTKGKDK